MQFYVGFNNYTKYNDLPLNISDIILEAIISFISDEVQRLLPLKGIIIKVILTIIQGALYFGLGFSAIIAVIFVCLIFKLISVITFFMRLKVGLLAVLYYIPFIITTIILYGV